MSRLYKTFINELPSKVPAGTDYIIIDDGITTYKSLISNLPSGGGSGGGQPSIQFQDEGTNVGTAGAASTLNFVGAGVSAAIVGSTLTVTIPGGGGGGQAAIQFQDEGINTGTSGAITNVNFTGAGVTSIVVGTAVTVDIPFSVEDTAYSSSWNGVANTAPSKNTVYDIMEDRSSVTRQSDSTIGSGSLIVDTSLGCWKKVTATGGFTLILSWPAGVRAMMIEAVNWGGNSITALGVQWPGGAQPSFTNTGKDHILFYTDGINVYGNRVATAVA